MGHWGTGIYDNDGACDWCSTYRYFGSEEFLRRTFQPTKDAPVAQPTALFGRLFSQAVPEFYISFDPDAVLAAADTVAAMFGHPSNRETRPVRRKIRVSDRELIDLAIAGAVYVRDRSYRKDGWMTAEKRRSWIESINDLVERLDAAKNDAKPDI